MAQPLPPQAIVVPLEALSPWDELSGLCEILNGLAAQVSQSLAQGGGPAVLVPLLRKELELARVLQEGIARCGQQSSTPQSKVRSKDLSGQLGALLETEQANQNLLQRRGIRLRGPRFPLSRLNGP